MNMMPNNFNNSASLSCDACSTRETRDTIYRGAMNIVRVFCFARVCVPCFAERMGPNGSRLPFDPRFEQKLGANISIFPFDPTPLHCTYYLPYFCFVYFLRVLAIMVCSVCINFSVATGLLPVLNVRTV
jgi:hypothetical protein